MKVEESIRHKWVNYMNYRTCVHAQILNYLYAYIYGYLFVRMCPYVLQLSAQSLWFVCVEDLRPSQPSGVMSGAVSLPNHTFTGQA